jgi:hypothetical protein
MSLVAHSREACYHSHGTDRAGFRSHRAFSASWYAVQIETEMQKLQQLYSVYEVHAKNVDSFSMVLWADLDVSKIIDVTEEVVAELKKKRMLCDMPLYDAVSKNILGFLASLPLMKELKSDALRKRHWNNLMTVPCTPSSTSLFQPHLCMTSALMHRSTFRDPSHGGCFCR